jgi:SAM-dependent methyltransferase
MIWQVVLIVSLILCACFGWVLIYGAPYLPTLKKQVEAAIELAALNKGDTIIELGCGDGRVLIEAAKRGYQSIGYELNPLLFLLAWIRTRKYNTMVRVIYGNFWKKDWPDADAIYVFLLPRLMSKLDKKIASENAAKGKVISFAFKFPDRKPVAEKDGVFIYDLKKPVG